MVTSNAARLLLSAARRLEPFDAGLAREAHLESLMAAYWVGPQDAPGPLSEAAQAACAAVPGALVHLQFALNYLASAQTAMGELAAATRLMEEDHLIAEATGNPPVALAEMMIATWRGGEDEASPPAANCTSRWRGSDMTASRPSRGPDLALAACLSLTGA